MLRHLSLFILTCLMAVSATHLCAEDPTELSFGMISTEASQNLKNTWGPLVTDMEKTLGLKVKAFFASDYAGIIEAMRFEKVDVAWMGNKSAIEAVDRSKGEVFANCPFANGDAGYWSLLIVSKDSPYNSLDEVLKAGKDLSFANGDPNSTSGFVVPGYYIFTERKLDPKVVFKRVTNGNHEANALAVGAKQVDVGTFNTEAWEALKKAHPDKADLIKPVWKSPLIPCDPLVYRTGLSEVLRGKIKAFFLSYGKNEDEKKVLADLGYKNFAESSNAQLGTIRKLELIKKRLKVAGDDKLSAEEKTKQIGELNAKLDAIDKQTAAATAK